MLSKRYCHGLLVRRGNCRAIEVTLQMFIGVDALDKESIEKLADLAYTTAVRKHWKRIILEPSLDGLYVNATNPANEGRAMLKLCLLTTLIQ